MKEQIIQLRKDGKTYNEIVSILGCAKSTISFHCNDKVRKDSAKRQRKNRCSNPSISKLQYFKRDVSERSRCFQRRSGSKLIPRIEYNFTVDDVLAKFGEYPTCYLTGRKIDIKDSKNFSFDHIVPSTKGGDNSLDNLGLVSYDVNKMKNNLTVTEFIDICKEVLIYNGYKISK